MSAAAHSPAEHEGGDVRLCWLTSWLNGLDREEPTLMRIAREKLRRLGIAVDLMAPRPERRSRR